MVGKLADVGLEVAAQVGHVGGLEGDVRAALLAVGDRERTVGLGIDVAAVEELQDKDAGLSEENRLFP